VHLTGGILRHFRAFSTPEQNPALGVLSTPAHPQVTQTVRQVFAVNLLHSFQKNGLLLKSAYRVFIIKFRVFSNSFGSFKSGLLAVAVFQVWHFSKIGSCLFLA
jgi:hypothetical protein